MDFGATLEADAQSSELVQPAQRALDHPSSFPQATAVRRSSMGDGRGDSPSPQGHSMLVRVISPISVQQTRPASWAPWLAPDRRNCVHQRNQLRDVVTIGRRERRRQRSASPIGEDVMLRPGFAAIRGIRAGLFAPPTARTLALSTAARDQSIRSAWCSRSNKTRWSFCHTPACCHSCSRFHKVIPQQPISWGKSSQGMPVLSTNRIPVRQTRSGLRGWPPLELGFHGGRIGSTSAQNSSSTSTLDMASSLMQRVASNDLEYVGIQGHDS